MFSAEESKDARAFAAGEAPGLSSWLVILLAVSAATAVSIPPAVVTAEDEAPVEVVDQSAAAGSVSKVTTTPPLTMEIAPGADVGARTSAARSEAAPEAQMQRVMRRRERDRRFIRWGNFLKRLAVEYGWGEPSIPIVTKASPRRAPGTVRPRQPKPALFKPRGLEGVPKF